MVGFLPARNWRKLYAARLSFRTGGPGGRLIGSMARAGGGHKPPAMPAAAAVRRKSRRVEVMAGTPGTGETPPVYAGSTREPRGPGNRVFNPERVAFRSPGSPLRRTLGRR